MGTGRVWRSGRGRARDFIEAVVAGVRVMMLMRVAGVWMPRVAFRFVAAAVVHEGRHPLEVRAPARASPDAAAFRRRHGWGP